LPKKYICHDGPPGLTEELAAAGFEADDMETVLVLELDDSALLAFDAPEYEIRTVHDAAGLADLATISTQLGRNGVAAETRRLEAMLRDADPPVSIHVAYVDGQPVACGRLHYGRTAGVAELAGGRTVTTHRRQGLFTALVAARLREAAEHGCRLVFVDALPTSEPILTKRGFTPVTSTQPFLYEPGS
jgi:N-acetylglutamate synthase-like GNAT family acetyltransferase